MRSGDRCGGSLPLQKSDVTTVAKALKRSPRRVPRSLGVARTTTMLRARTVAGSNVHRFVAGTGRFEERIAHVLLGAARPFVAGHLALLALVLGGFLAVGDLSGGPLALARLALAATLIWLVRRLGKRPNVRVGSTPAVLPAQLSVLWLALLPWLLTVWLAAPLVFGWIGVGLPFTLAGAIMSLTLALVLVFSVRAVADAQQATWRSEMVSTNATNPAGWERYAQERGFPYQRTP